MKFNLYAAGSSSEIIEDFKREINYDQLLSQLNERRPILKWVEYLKNHPECKSKLFIDSGAYSAHTLGKEVDVDDYIKFINEIDDYVTIFAQVDHIPGKWGRTPTAEEAAEAPKLSWENYLYMVERVKSPKKLIPVFHQGEDFSWLENMLNYKYEDGTYIDYIGISCNKSLNSSAWVAWFENCFKVIYSSKNPNVKTHAFGMTSRRLLEQFNFTSSDSTTWIRSAGFGQININGHSVYVSDQNERNFDVSKVEMDHIEKICKAIGVTVDELRTEHDARSKFNLYELNEWANNYKPCTQKIFKNNLW